MPLRLAKTYRFRVEFFPRPQPAGVDFSYNILKPMQTTNISGLRNYRSDNSGWVSYFDKTGLNLEFSKDLNSKRAGISFETIVKTVTYVIRNSSTFSARENFRPEERFVF